MLVSVIVPVYNTQDYLDKCIRTLLKQTYENIEIILVNDGSSDKSLEICKKYHNQDSRIIVIDKKNGGASSARNVGIQVASGEYIMFVDSDDYVDENYVKEMLCAQLNHVDSFVICDLCGVLSDDTHVPLHGEICEEGIFQLKDYYRFAKCQVLNQPVNKIYSLKKIKENNLSFKDNLPIAEDVFFNLEYLQLCTMLYFINNELYFCLTDRAESLCHRYYDNLIDINRMVFDKHRELFSIFQVNDEYKKMLISNYYGEHIDSLDREIAYAKSKKMMFENMRDILQSENFQLCLEQCEADIPKLYYFILSTKNPRLYYWYHKLSKLRGSK